MNTLVTVNDQKYTVPQQITVEQWEAIYNWGLDNPKSRKMVCAVILGAELNAFNNVADEDLETLFAICLTPLASFLDKPKETECAIDFEHLTFGQFIDLDVISHRGLYQHLSEAIAVIYDLEVELVQSKPVEDYWYGITRWLEVRSNIYSQYSSFFNLEENTESTQASEEEVHDVRRVWYMAVIALAAEDFMKVHQVVERPVFEAMNFLAYLKDQNFKREQQNRANRAKIKTR
jgi:hypothetical protein